MFDQKLINKRNRCCTYREVMIVYCTCIVLQVDVCHVNSFVNIIVVRKILELFQNLKHRIRAYYDIIKGSSMIFPTYVNEMNSEKDGKRCPRTMKFGAKRSEGPIKSNGEEKVSHEKLNSFVILSVFLQFFSVSYN